MLQTTCIYWPKSVGHGIAHRTWHTMQQLRSEEHCKRREVQKGLQEADQRQRGCKLLVIADLSLLSNSDGAIV